MACIDGRFGSRQLRELRCRRAHLPSTEMSTAISSKQMPFSVLYAVGTITVSMNALDAGLLSGPRFLLSFPAAHHAVPGFSVLPRIIDPSLSYPILDPSRLHREQNFRWSLYGRGARLCRVAGFGRDVMFAYLCMWSCLKKLMLSRHSRILHE